MNELAVFAGAGGGILGSHLLGWRTVCAVERDAYAAAILAQRQNDGVLPIFPIWSDVQTFDGKKWRGIVDVVSGGFPCQDISIAGKGAGITGERSGLWKDMYRVVCEVRPRYVFVENSPMLISRGLGTILGDLAQAGYDCQWLCLSAAQVGAKHKRDRIWIMGNAHHNGQAAAQKPSGIAEGSNSGTAREKPTRESAGSSMQYAELADTHAARLQRHIEKTCQGSPATCRQSRLRCGAGNRRNRWPPEPDVGRVVNGMAFRVDRIKAIGNGQVPTVAQTAWIMLSGVVPESAH